MSVFFFQAEDGIRDLVRSRGLGDVYKRQVGVSAGFRTWEIDARSILVGFFKSIVSDSPLGSLSLIHI